MRVTFVRSAPFLDVVLALLSLVESQFGWAPSVGPEEGLPMAAGYFRQIVSE